LQLSIVDKTGTCVERLFLAQIVSKRLFEALRFFIR
jgi:hypothetical protein